MKSQHCRLVCPIVLLLCGACSVYGYEDTCEFLKNYECTLNVTRRYGFNIYNPDILDQLPILNGTEFAELCSDYISMVNCLKDNRPCDYRSRRYTRYALSLAVGLDYACRKEVLEDYAAVVSCFQETEVQSGYKSCHETLRTDIQTLVNKTVEESSTSRIDISVVVEKACQYVISSMDCTSTVLLHSCSSFVEEWYHRVFTEMMQPTLDDYRCLLYMPLSKMVTLFFVSVAAAVVIGVAIYVCFQRYQSVMRSRMNFVLSVIPKAQKTLQHLDPKIISRNLDPTKITQSFRMPKNTGEVSTTEQPAASAVSQQPPTDPASAHVLQEVDTAPPPIDPATARVLQQLAAASQQTAPGQRQESTSSATKSAWRGWFT